MSWAEEFMAEALAAVSRRSKSTTHKISTMAWYTGRKQLMNAPRKAIGAVVGLAPIPGMGTIVDLALDKAVDKIKKDRLAKKMVMYSNPLLEPNLEDLRHAAKADAKGLKETAEKIDSNHPKLKTTSNELNANLQTLAMASSAGVPTKDQLWKVAMGIYERRRYEDKIQMLVETAREYLDVVEKHISASRTQTCQLEADFLAELNAVELQVIVPSQRPSSPSGYGRII